MDGEEYENTDIDENIATNIREGPAKNIGENKEIKEFGNVKTGMDKKQKELNYKTEESSNIFVEGPSSIRADSIYFNHDNISVNWIDERENKNVITENSKRFNHNERFEDTDEFHEPNSMMNWTINNGGTSNEFFVP